jgi:hypothetical protein
MAVEPQRPSHEPGSPPVLKYGRHAHGLPPAAHHVIHHISAAFDADSTLPPVLETKQADDPVHDGAAEHEVRVSHAYPSVCQAQHQPAIFRGWGGLFVSEMSLVVHARVCMCAYMLHAHCKKHAPVHGPTVRVHTRGDTPGTVQEEKHVVHGHGQHVPGHATPVAHHRRAAAAHL